MEKSPPLTEELLTVDDLLGRKIQVFFFSKSMFPGIQKYMTAQIGVYRLSENEENEYEVERE